MSEIELLPCHSCGAVGYGNATCRKCVAEWPRLGISQEFVTQVLAIIGDQPAMPCGPEDIEAFVAIMGEDDSE